MRKAAGRQFEYFRAREKAAELVQSAFITHRPDHNIAGEIYQASAYRKFTGEDGESRLIIRKELRGSAQAGGLVDTSAEKTRRNIESIVSPRVRKHVLRVFDHRVNAGKTHKQALAEPIYQDWYGGEKKPIIRVRVYGQPKGKPIKIGFQGDRQHGGYKHLISGNYAYLRLFFDENGQPDTSRSGLVSMADAIKGSPDIETNEWRYYKGDIVTDMVTGERLLVRQFDAQSGGRIYIVPLTETRPFGKITESEGAVKRGISSLSRYRPDHAAR